MNLEQILEKLPHKRQVQFAYECCLEIKHLLTDSRSLKALEVIELWLKDSNAVSKDLLEEIIDNANNTFNAATFATAYIARGAANVGDSAANTTRAARIANLKYGIVGENDLKTKLLNSLSEFEKVLYNI